MSEVNLGEQLTAVGNKTPTKFVPLEELFIEELLKTLNWNTEIEGNDRIEQEELKSCCKIPSHIAIIMDGNGRWANERGELRVTGHREGIESVRDIVKSSDQLGIKFLTLYAFSIENWRRPQQEVSILMNLLEFFLRNELAELHANNVRIRAIGKVNALPRRVQKSLFRSIETTKGNTGLTLTLCLSYSSRWDITRSLQLIALDVRSGKLSPEDINEDLLTSYLQTSFLPEPDLVIRTSGELRVSNFLLWEIAYSEIYVTEELWPDFRRNSLYSAIRDYARRERRFGMTSAQLSVRQSESTSAFSSIFTKVVNAISKK